MAAAVAAADEKIDKLRAAVAQLDQISRAPLPSPTSSAKSKWSNHETKASQETRSRPFYKPTYRGSKAGSDRSGRFHSGFGDSTGSVKGPIKKEIELHSPPNSSILDSVKASNPMETISAAGVPVIFS